MPARVAKVGKKYRLVEGDTGKIVKNASGTAVNGGGHLSRDAAIKQAAAINISQSRKRPKKQ